MLHFLFGFARKGAKTLSGFCGLRVVCGEGRESFFVVKIVFDFVIIDFGFVGFYFS